MDLKQILTKLGFKENKARIYLACLELGIATAGQLAKKAGVERTYFYDLVEELVNQGFIIQTAKGKKRYFTAESPKKIIQIQKENLKMAEEALPELESIYNTSGKKPKVSFYDGQEGLSKVYEDAYSEKRRGKEIVAFSSEKFLAPKHKKLVLDYMWKRVKAGVSVRGIVPVDSEILKEKERDKKVLREIRLLPKNLLTSDMEMTMYDNKVAFINFKREFGLIIESKEIAEALKDVFELVWDSGKIIR